MTNALIGSALLSAIKTMETASRTEQCLYAVMFGRTANLHSLHFMRQFWRRVVSLPQLRRKKCWVIIPSKMTS